MKIACFISFVVFFFILGNLPIYAQTGPVERELNFWGFYTYRQNGQKIQERELLRQMEPNQFAHEALQKAHRSKTWSQIFLGTGLLVNSYQIFHRQKYDELSQEVLYVTAGFLGAGLVFNHRARVKATLALDYYNRGLAKSSFKSKPEFQIGFAGTSVGLQMKF